MTNTTQFANNATSTLAAALTASATSFAVASGTGALFPVLTTGQTFYATLASATATTIEIVSVTATSTDTFTVVRGQNGTTAAAFASGDKVELRITAASAANWEAKAAAGANADITALSACTTLTNVSTINGSSYPPAATGSPTGFLNKIQNGAMLFDQQNLGASITPIVNTTYVADRWRYRGNLAGVFTSQQVTGVFGNFTNYLQFTCAATDAIGANDFFGVSQGIEACNSADFLWGTVNAKGVMLTFTASSSLTGTFGGAIRSTDGSRSYAFSFSLPTANTPTPVTIAIAGDSLVSAHWPTGVGVSGPLLDFSLGAGASVSQTPGAWGNAVAYSATGAVQVMNTAGATFAVTGVQLAIGTSAITYEQRPYQVELELCQRYCFAWTGAGATLSYFAASTGDTSVLFSTPMAFAPTFTAITQAKFNNSAGTAGIVPSASIINASYVATSYSAPMKFTLSGAAGLTAFCVTEGLYIFRSDF